MQQPVVRVGEWLVTPSINQISRNGRQLTLEPRLIDLLVFFAQHSGWICPYISRHLLSLNPLLACCR
ncbi:hypothetical protein, partial [Escherichia coli]|uniref:hypothetical protein n=1 Tax=Escherichia coli TaxID=562 RepID=UPI0023624C7D